MRCRGGILLLMGVVGLAVAVGCGSRETKPREPGRTPAAVDAAPLPEDHTLIVAMGDSLTEGLNLDLEQAYPAQLERLLRARGHRVRVTNAGIAGETSRGALARIDWVLKLKPDIVVLETGGNDGLRGIDPDITAANIDRIVARLRAEGLTVVLAGMQIVQNMGQPYVDEFRAIYPEIAASHGIPWIPFFLEGVAGDPTLNQADGIHPTAAGYRRVAETVANYIEPLLAK